MTRALRHTSVALVFAALASVPLGAASQPAVPPPPYGPPITLEQAAKVMAAAEVEARKNGWAMVIAIIDSGGHLVMLHRLDNAQYGSIEIAKGKAVTAVNFKRPSKILEDAVAAGGAGLRLLRVEGITPIEGGIPIVVNGQIIGGIGVSGAPSPQDAQVARAGVDALK